MNALPEGVIRLGRKEYHTVAKRVSDFRDTFGEKYGLVTEIIDNGDRVVIRALIIGRDDNFVVATGTAEELRGSSQVNKTSALENCETSAIGRALAAFGIGGTEFASANEVQNAIHQQEGHSQGDDQGAISPPASEPNRKTGIKLDGPYATSITGLEKGIKAFVADLRKVGSREELDALKGETKFEGLLEQAERDHPDWWAGWQGMPDGFTPLKVLLEKVEADIEADEEAYTPNILQAG